MFDHEIRMEMARSRAAQLQCDWGAFGHARYALGAWLIRLGRRLASEPPRSALAHEALPRC